MEEIVTLTMNPALDMNFPVPHVAPERKLRCGPPRYEPGGGGINVSRAIQRLGGESTAYYSAGGAVGQMLIDLLKQENVEHYPLQIEAITRLNTTVLDEESGQQYRFVMPGPELKEEEWQRCLEEVIPDKNTGTYIVASGSLPRNVPVDFYGRLANLARKAGHYLLVDSSGDALKEAARKGVYLLKPNMRELAQLAGHEIENENQQEEAAQKIIADGQAEIIVVSLGAGGALFVTKDELERIPAPTVKIRSKIGAGDSMVAGIVLALARGKAGRVAAHYGVAAGAAAVMTPGTELCHRADTERLYEEILD